tara:strand:- start:243 stop:947 length:705 start_codon:yes stop_codon:yes gene_type:complete
MRKIAIIPSKTPIDYLRSSTPKNLVNYFKFAGWEVYVMDGCSSIFEAYEKGVRTANVKSDDYVIMCHDDINILTNPIDFNSIIEGFLQKKKIGFLGVAGTKILRENCIWWQGMEIPGQNHLAGFVYHGNTLFDMQATFYGQPGPVVAMDGVFLACLGSTLLNIRLTQPQMFVGAWDFYDIYYTLQAHFKGLKNHVVPIQIFHQSLGDTNGKTSWHKNREALIHHLGDKLPVILT